MRVSLHLSIEYRRCSIDFHRMAVFGFPEISGRHVWSKP
jgi:hypothetical protein